MMALRLDLPKDSSQAYFAGPLTMTQENLIGRSIAGYRLLDRIGEGGTATVYRAEHPERGVCAVKLLRERMRKDPTAVKRFLREAGYGTRVSHDAVIRTYDFGEEDGVHYLALEWAEGEPLSDFVHRTGRLAPDLVAHLVRQLAGGLMVAHAAGIVHRDLKPENLIYNPETRILKLLDFGIARDAQENAGEERLTRTGFFVGTLNYVAPEALSGELVEEAADLYSLGTISYYLLTGVHPYTGRSPRELFQQLLTQDPTSLNDAVSGVSFAPELEKVVMKALARSPGDRQASVESYADEFEAALMATGASAGSIPPEPSKEEGPGIFGKVRSLFKGKNE
jgi:serine/threonine-protein kinase